jgi:hypothetical protein
MLKIGFKFKIITRVIAKERSDCGDPGAKSKIYVVAPGLLRVRSQ